MEDYALVGEVKKDVFEVQTPPTLSMNEAAQPYYAKEELTTDSMGRFTDLVLKYAEIVVREAHAKVGEYPTRGNGRLALLLQVAESEGLGEWQIFRSWMKRHLIPFQYLTEIDGHPDFIEKRLRDLLGYIFLGLELNEYMKERLYNDNWEKLREMGKSVSKKE